MSDTSSSPARRPRRLANWTDADLTQYAEEHGVPKGVAEMAKTMAEYESQMIDAANAIPDPPHGTISAIELDGTPEDDGRPPLTDEQRAHVRRTDRIEELDNALIAARGVIEQAAATVAMNLLAVMAEESWREFTTIEYASDDADEKTPVTREFSRFRDFVNRLNGAGDTLSRHMIENLLPYTPDSYFDEDGFTVDGLAASAIYYMAMRRKDADVCDDARKVYHRISRNIEKG